MVSWFRGSRPIRFPEAGLGHVYRRRSGPGQIQTAKPHPACYPFPAPLRPTRDQVSLKQPPAQQQPQRDGPDMYDHAEKNRAVLDRAVNLAAAQHRANPLITTIKPLGDAQNVGENFIRLARKQMPCTAHSAHNLVQRGADLRRLMQWMGHSNINTNLIYARRQSTKARIVRDARYSLLLTEPRLCCHDTTACVQSNAVAAAHPFQQNTAAPA